MNNTVMASTYTTEIKQLSDGRVLRHRLFRGEEPLSWSDVLGLWQNDPLFRSFFMSLLADAPFPAYFWETPPVTISTITEAFEFVLVESQVLAGVRSDRQAFANHFAAVAEDESVIEFSNLGGDATLVVPCPRGPLSAYSQISEFARRAPENQQHQLWAMVGATLKRQLGKQPVWLSTSGLGVYWLHIRLDSTPKYYTHRPYRDH
jgi:hypothetical protein